MPFPLKPIFALALLVLVALSSQPAVAMEGASGSGISPASVASMFRAQCAATAGQQLGAHFSQAQIRAYCDCTANQFGSLTMTDLAQIQAGGQAAAQANPKIMGSARQCAAQTLSK